MYQRIVNVPVVMNYEVTFENFDGEGDMDHETDLVYNYGTGRTTRESRRILMIKQKLVGMGLLAITGFYAFLGEPAIGFFTVPIALTCLFAKKPDVLLFER